MTRLAAWLIAVSSVTMAAAHQAAPDVQFEVASVKVNASGDTDSTVTIGRSGQVSMINATLRDIITHAFQLNLQTARFVFAGWSERLLLTRFDIAAKAPADAPTGQAPAMLRTLLAQRFGLRAHTETRDIPIYALKVANTGRFGPALRPSQHNCEEFLKMIRQGKAVEPTDASGKGWCRTNPFDRDGYVVRGAGTVAQLIRSVQGQADRLIVDMTGLGGKLRMGSEIRSRFDRSSEARVELPRDVYRLS